MNGGVSKVREHLRWFCIATYIHTDTHKSMKTAYEQCMSLRMPKKEKKRKGNGKSFRLIT